MKPSHGAAQLRRIDDLRLQDCACDDILNGIARLAADGAGQPIALISLIHSDHQTVRWSAGLSPQELPISWPLQNSPCGHAIRSPGEVFEVQDARHDPRFENHPAVRGSVGLVHYAGVALMMPNGDAVGTVCVVDTGPGRLAGPQRVQLMRLAEQVIRVLLMWEQHGNLERDKLLQEAMDVDLAELAPCGMYALDSEGMVVRANENWARLLGAPSVSDVLGDAWSRYVHAEDVEHVLQVRRAGLVNGHAYTFSFRTSADKEGAAKWLRVRVRPVSAALAPVAFVGAAVDETQIREIGDELRRQNRLLETIIHNLPCGLAVLDADFRPVISNEVARQLLESDDAILEVATPQLLPMARRIAPSHDVRSVQPAPTLRSRADSPVSLMQSATLAGGWAVTTFTDVSAARRAANNLRISEERLESALEASGLLLWQLDVRRKTILLPGSTAAFFGRAAVETELSIQEFFECALPEFHEQIATEYRDLCTGKVERSRIQYCARRPDGASMWVLAFGKVTERAPDGTALTIVGTCKDVSSAVEAEENLKAAVQAAEEANRAKREFLATMSHEIRTPLNGVVGLAKILSQSDLPPRERGSVEMLRGCAKTLLSIIDNILDFSKIEAGHLSLELVPTDLHHLVEETKNVSHVRAVDKGITFEADVARNAPAWITGDPTRLRQILLNLVGNALKFTDVGSVHLRVRVASSPKGDRLHFAIQDTGIGIPQAALAGLFTRFRQVDSSTTRRFGGSGLGLAISRQLAHLMGGDIHVESCEGKGSTFTLDIPLKLASPPRQASVSSPGALRPDAKILIAEDNEVNQHVLHRMLSMLGYRDITIVNDGGAAVHACRVAAFELVLMDCQMPVMDGRDATRRLRGAGLDMPVLALTASATDRDREECLAAGMDDYLTKPIELPVLGEKVQKWLKEVPPARSDEAMVEPPGHATFNRGAIKQYFLGDADFFAQAREMFIRTAGKDVEQMRSAVSAGDGEAARRISHRIKASAATMGAERLSILCKQYEAGEVEPSAEAAWIDDAAGAFDAFVQASNITVGDQQETSFMAAGGEANSVVPVDGSDARGRDSVGPSRTILVVEDEPDMLATTQAMLEMAGYRVRTASDGGRALSILEEDTERIDLVYTDFMMPVVDGLNLCRRLRARPQTRALPVVLTSGAITTAPGEPGLFNSFVRKPVVFADLLRVIEGVLGQGGA